MRKGSVPAATFLFIGLIFAVPTVAFEAFDALAFPGKPDLSTYGLARLETVYAGDLWDLGESRDTTPRYEKVVAVVNRVRPSTLAWINIEHWPYVVSKTPTLAAEGIQKYNSTINAFNYLAPDVAWGYYCIVPVRDYWRALQPVESALYKSWQRDNDYLSGVASRSRILFPSLYTFYPDKAGWVRYALANIAEARRMAGTKPVYVVLRPTYHESNLALANSYIDREFWRLQLEVARVADGVVIWQSSATPWNESAAWWVETKLFLKSMGLAR